MFCVEKIFVLKNKKYIKQIKCMSKYIDTHWVNHEICTASFDSFLFDLYIGNIRKREFFYVIEPSIDGDSVN